MFADFTERARDVLSTARRLCIEHKQEFVGTEHLLLAILHQEGCVAQRVFARLRIDAGKIEESVRRQVSPSDTLDAAIERPMAPRLKRVIEIAREHGYRLGTNVVGTAELVLGLLEEDGPFLTEGIAHKALLDCKIDIPALRSAMEIACRDSVQKREPDSGDPGILPVQTLFDNLSFWTPVNELDQVSIHVNGKEVITSLTTKKGAICLIGEPILAKLRSHGTRILRKQEKAE